ncbi:alpha-1A adrenergic receptor [Austrofundulus limnaeus]|uniref:Alpha-1A adrenergic receptor n=1 Tax=Austrofundulus limnaeus TaxID=52670 RepID=A0A2I4BID9_AUSLI|nr:PREDICTED: alpha-1A adrenergic receptor [Austrofundulus limnaeus]XP_013867516.1 PREDICTED: alpha-1A adrenergic receptor [Austrofundulus limnaeus]
MGPLPDNMSPASLSQNCSNCSHILAPGLSMVKTVALGTILGVFILFGVIGNILVILSVVCHRHLRTVTHYFIVNLAVADLLLSSTVLPFSAIFEILDRWVFGRVFCNVWAAVDVLCCTASIMSLCVISVDRYIGVSYPLRYPSIVTKRRALLAVMLLWALSVVISIGPLFGWKEPEPEDESICKITEEPGYAIFSAVGSFYLPLTIILVMYCRVYVVAHRESQGLREGHKTEKSDSEQVILRMHRGNTTVSEDEALRSRTHFALRLLKFSREKKAAKTLGIVVGCFILCWLPFFLVLPIGSIFPAYRPSDTVFKITFWLGYFNSCINPIIYPCSNQEFKKAFQSLLGVHCLRMAPRTHHHHHLSASQSQTQGQSQALTLSLDSRGASCRLSPSSSIALSRTPSSRDSREWKVFSEGHVNGRAGQAKTSGAKVAKLCNKNFQRTCCCILRAGGPPQEPPPITQLPTIKIHQLSLSEKGDAV